MWLMIALAAGVVLGAIGITALELWLLFGREKADDDDAAD